MAAYASIENPNGGSKKNSKNSILQRSRCLRSSISKGRKTVNAEVTQEFLGSKSRIQYGDQVNLLNFYKLRKMSSETPGAILFAQKSANLQGCVVIDK